MKRTKLNKTKAVCTVFLASLIIFGGVCADAEESSKSTEAVVSHGEQAASVLPEATDTTTTYSGAGSTKTADGENADCDNINGSSPSENKSAASDPVNYAGGESASSKKDDTPDKKDNVFTQIYDAFISHASVIFSTLSFAVSLVLTIICKKGIFPMISKSMISVKSAIKGIDDTVVTSGNAYIDKLGKQSEAISEMKNEITGLKGELAGALEEIECRRDSQAERERMRIIMQGQIDMLYDIFMTSAIPQYKKDDVGMRITAMKEQLASNE